MPRSGPCILLALWGCSAPPSPGDVGDDTATSDTETHTDSDASTPAEETAAGDSDTDGQGLETGDTSETGDTQDSQPPADTGLDPVTLTGMFTPISDAYWSHHAHHVKPRGGASALPGYTTFLAGDLDGNGDLELVVSGVSYDAHPDAFPGAILDFDATTSTLTENAPLSAYMRDASQAMVLSVLDLNGDGHADILRKILDDNLVNLGDGQGGFTKMPVTDLLTSRNAISSDGVALYDVDNDGWLDIVTGNKSCLPTQSPAILPLLRTSSDGFTAKPELVEGSLHVDPYALLATTFDGTYPVFAAVGRSCFQGLPSPGFARWKARNDEGYPVFDAYDPIPSDAMFRLVPSGFDLTFTQRQPMGAVTLDIDLDGRIDLISAVSDDYLFAFRGQRTTDLLAHTLDAGIELPWGAAGSVSLPWGVVNVDLDRDGAPDLVVAHGDDTDAYRNGSLNEPYPVTTWVNDGTGGFTSVDAISASPHGANWRALARADVNGDAAPDLLVGGYGEVPRLLVDSLDTTRTHVALRFVGTTSNHLGIGAMVKLEVDGLPDQVHLVAPAASPDLIEEPAIYAGLGDAPSVDRLTITWPSGHTQVVTGLAANQWHTLTEPPTITLTPSSRHAPADGTSEVHVDVVVRDTDGTPDGLATVDIETLHGDATWKGATYAHGDGFRRTLVAPNEAGSSVLTVTVDGAARPLHPRVWWDALP